MFNSCMSCSEEKKNRDVTFTEFEQSLTSEDSIKVADLVATFFDYAKNADYEGAADMLYTNINGDKTEAPRKLNDKEKNEVKTMLAFFRPKDFKISFMKFSYDFDNEVECDVFLKEHEEGVPDVKTKFFFLPHKYEDVWFLTLVDSRNNDMPTVSGKDRDSVRNNYRLHKSSALKKDKRF